MDLFTKLQMALFNKMSCWYLKFIYLLYGTQKFGIYIRAYTLVLFYVEY